MRNHKGNTGKFGGNTKVDWRNIRSCKRGKRHANTDADNQTQSGDCTQLRTKGNGEAVMERDVPEFFQFLQKCPKKTENAQNSPELS